MKRFDVTSPYLAIDIETKPQEGGAKDDALNFHRNQITVVAVADVHSGVCYRNLRDLADFRGKRFVTHNGKFDFKNLIHHGAPLSFDQYADDTMLMATTLAEKIPESWLLDYDQARRELNKSFGKQVHRQAGKHSLKALAPYFLGVDPFWETESHDNDEYVIKDALYTAQLAVVLEKLLKESGGWDFYKKHLLSWNRTLMQAEYRGIKINFDTLSEMEVEYKLKADEAEGVLRTTWGEHFQEYEKTQRALVTAEYLKKKAAAIAKLAPSKRKDPNAAALETAEKISRTAARYDASLQGRLEKVKPLNLGSPTQLKWLLKERMGLDLLTFDEKDESTGKAVLERLKDEGVHGVSELIDYRKANKLVTAFFPSYRTLNVGGIIHTTYNVDVARTGRLSSSEPNLQQISKKILRLFEARPGYKLAYRDIGAVEPRLVAYTTECPILCDIFINDGDFHSENVRAMVGIQEDDATIKEKYKAERDLAKEVGLALMYGAMHKRIQECAAKRGFRWSERQCKAMYRSFQQKYSAVWEYKAQLEDSIKRGERVFNLFGRPLSFDAERLHMQSLNTQIQSGGSDLLLASADRATLECERLKLEAYPLLFIHDSFTAEAPSHQVEQVFNIIGDAISSWQLPTQWGNIPLISEGHIAERLSG